LSVKKQRDKGDDERTKDKEKDEETHFRRKLAGLNLVTSLT